MATVTRPPAWTPPTRPPTQEELEALIEEARQRQRRRQRRIGAVLALAASACGLGVYLGAAHGGSTAPAGRPNRPAALRAPTGPKIVFAADRVAIRSGEIYAVGPSGRRVDLSRSSAFDTSAALSPDGRWVAFLSNRSGAGALYAVRTNGRSLTKLSRDLVPSAGLQGQIAWSPDGRRIAVAASNGSSSSVLYLTRLGAKGTVAGHDFADELAWSADGRLLAFRGLRELHVVGRTGAPAWHVPRNPRSIAWSKSGLLAVDYGRTTTVYDQVGLVLGSVPGSSYWSPWSPTGQFLATRVGRRLEVRHGGLHSPWFTTSVPAPGSISWVGETEVRITSDGSRTDIDVTTGRRHVWFSPPEIAAASSSGSRIAFVVAVGDRYALKVARRDGSHARVVARARCNRDNGSPFEGIQFSHDGRSLVYQTACGEPNANVYAVSPDGTHLRRLTQTSANQISPALSPTGRAIAFSQSDAVGLACKGCPSAVWRMDANGAHARALTQPGAASGAQDLQPSWSPDGKRIVFPRSSAFSDSSLYVVPSAGGAARALHVKGSLPAWGPAKIAYFGNAGGIWTVNPDGSDARRLAGGRDIDALAWSADGKLAYLSGRGTAVHVIGIGGRQTSVRIPANGTAVGWSPDGTRLLVSASKGTLPTELYTLDPGGRRLTPLTTNMGSIAGMSWR